MTRKIALDRVEEAVEQWAGERPDLPLLPMAVVSRLADATARIMRDHLGPLLAEAGLQPGEFEVLAALRRSGPPYMLSPTQLYEALMISSGGMTNRLDRLEQAHLIERLPDPSDRRGKRIALTAAGRRVIDKMIARYATAEKRILSTLTGTEQESLNTLLKKLIAGL